MMEARTSIADKGQRKAPRHYRAREDLLYRKLVDGGMVYDSVSTQVHHLNASASLVWEFCQEGGSLDKIVREMCARFDVGQTDAEADVAAILGQYAQVALLEAE